MKSDKYKLAPIIAGRNYGVPMLKKGLFVAACILLLACNAGALDNEKYGFEMYDFDVDYAALHLRHIDNEGFAEYCDEYACFKWRNHILLPPETPLVGLGPLTPYAEMIMEIRDINGTVFIPDDGDFEGRENYPLVEGKDYFEGDASKLGYFRKVQDLNAVTIYGEWQVISILGNNMFDPPGRSPFVVNNGENKFLNIAIFVPRHLQLLDYFSNKNIFKVNEHAVFSYQYNLTSVIYADPAQKLMVQAGLGLLTILGVFIVLSLYRRIPKLNIRSRHFAIAMLLCGLLMVQFAFLVPNPDAINYQWWLKPQYDGKIPAYYLSYVLGMTDSMDAIFIRSFSWNENTPFSTNRNVFLLMRSAQRIYIPQELEDKDGTVALIAENVGQDKIEIISESEIPVMEAEWEGSRNYLWGFLFGPVRVTVYLVFLMMSFAATAFVFTRVFEIRGRREWLIAALILLAVPFIMLFNNLVTGFIAHMPVTYHGASTMPLTMSANALPFFGQAHSLRAAVLMMGVMFSFIFVANIRKRISIRAFLLPVLVFSLLLTLPMTEFSTKRAVTSFACGNCGIHYDGELEWLNFQDTYAALRNNDDLAALLGSDPREQLEKARILQMQGRPQSSIEAYEKFIYENPDDKQIVVALLELGWMYDATRQFEKSVWAFETALGSEPTPNERANIYLGLGATLEHSGDKGRAVEIYGDCISSIEVEDYVVECTYRRAELNRVLGNRGEAIRDFRTVVTDYPLHRIRELAEARLNSILEGPA